MKAIRGLTAYQSLQRERICRMADRLEELQAESPSKPTSYYTRILAAEFGYKTEATCRQALINYGVITRAAKVKSLGA